VNVVVVHAHPEGLSFSASLRDTAVDALRAAGHTVHGLSLYDEGFRAAMTADEHSAYHSPAPILDPQVQRHADLVRAAEVLVFVYPTWWAGLPAVLKGWLERVMVPGVAFDFDPVTNAVRPALRRLRVIVGISTYGSPRWFTFAVADAGRRTLTRALRLCCPGRTKRVWLGLYAVDTSTPEQRAAFVARVDRRLRAL
jgi:putative NADPH-quinone reductase